MSAKRLQTLVIAMLLASASACKHKQEPNKILDGLSVASPQTIAPAQIAQQFFALQRDSMDIITTVIDRLDLIDPTFPELGTPDGQSRYPLPISGKFYGTASFTIQFRDNSDAVIDPIANPASTSTIASVLVAATGNSPEYSYTENIRLTLGTAGVVSSKKRMTGTSSFSGSSYSITFTFLAPGPNATFEGLTDGTVNAAGTGGTPARPTSLRLDFSADHTANGSLIWEGKSGGLHFRSDATGFLITNQSRYLIN